MNLTLELLRSMLDAARRSVQGEVEMLNRLDSAIGDGDHGTAIVAAMNAASAASGQDGTLASVLEKIGWEVMSCTSGSTSALTGSFYIGMASAATGDSLTTDQVIALFEAGLENVRVSTQAGVGDKTLMDALIPAVESMSKQKGNEIDLATLFRGAARAAQEGAERTEQLVARFGRARNLGPRSVGHRDAGAVSTALIYAAYADAIDSVQEV